MVVPVLPGCVSEGDTEEEALEHIGDAMVGWLAVAGTHGLYVPAPERVKLSTVGVPA